MDTILKSEASDEHRNRDEPIISIWNHVAQPREGIGTVLELMMVWQLLQVRKLHDTPLILAGAMWEGLVEWARKSMLLPDCPLASPEDFAIPVCCRTGPEILDVLREHYTQWKSNQEAAP